MRCWNRTKGALFWTYGIGQLVNGRLSELVGPSWIIIAAVVLSAVANILVATQDAASVVILAIIWGANGFFQSMDWTPGLGWKAGFLIPPAFFWPCWFFTC